MFFRKKFLYALHHYVFPKERRFLYNIITVISNSLSNTDVECKFSRLVHH